MLNNFKTNLFSTSFNQNSPVFIYWLLSVFIPFFLLCRKVSKFRQAAARVREAVQHLHQLWWGAHRRPPKQLFREEASVMAFSLPLSLSLSVLCFKRRKLCPLDGQRRGACLSLVRKNSAVDSLPQFSGGTLPFLRSRLEASACPHHICFYSRRGRLKTAVSSLKRGCLPNLVVFLSSQTCHFSLRNNSYLFHFLFFCQFSPSRKICWRLEWIVWLCCTPFSPPNFAHSVSPGHLWLPAFVPFDSFQ